MKKIDAVLYVKKIYSLKPTQYKFIPLIVAEKLYKIYKKCHIKYWGKKSSKLKDFGNWLETEI